MLALLALGVILGFARPLWGLFILITPLAITSSLPWQLGGPNVVMVIPAALGLCLGRAVGELASRWGDRPRPTPPLAGVALLAAAATLVTLSMSTLVALSRLPLAQVATSPGISSALWTFNPVGLPGLLQSALIPFLGLGIFCIATKETRRQSARRRFLDIYCLGLAIVISTPLVQYLFLDPTVRPQENATEVDSLVAFFQDPHSFAAYLVISFGVALGGLEIVQSLTGHIARVGLASGCVILLLYTESRSGLAALIVCAVVYLWSPALAKARVMGGKSQRRALGRALSAVLVVSLAITAIWLVRPVRGALYEGLVLLGNERMWEPLDPEGPEHPFLARRFLHLEKGRILLARYPIWGTGPQGYQDTAVVVPEDYLARYAASYGSSELADGLRELREENAHNYFMQYAVEYGLPALATLAALLFAVLARGFRAVGRGSRGDRQLARGLTASMVGFLFLSLVSHPLLLAELQVVFWALCGLTMNLGVVDEELTGVTPK